MEAKDSRSRCFFDIIIGGLPCGRIVFELYNDIVPKTSDNFRSFCAGDKGLGKNTDKPLTYNNVIFHRVVKDFIIQGGDFSNGNGTGGESIYGGTFDDENFVFKHDQPFLLSMANRGKNTNGSQFFITTQPAPHLDNIHVVFGRVVGGTDVVRQIENLSVDTNSRPLQDVRISKCGELVRQTKASKKKKHTGSSNEEIASDEEERSSTKKKYKEKKKSRKEKKSERSHTKQIVIEKGDIREDLHPLVSVSNINPEDIPDVPVNKFLLRGESRNYVHNRNKYNDRGGGFHRYGYNWSYNNRRNGRDFRKQQITKSGRSIKGRGVFRFRTPSRSRSRSRSGTPIHWRKEEARVIKLSEYEKQEEPAKPTNTVASTVAVVQQPVVEQNKRSERQDRPDIRDKSTDKEKGNGDNEEKIDYNALDYEDDQHDMRQHLLDKRNRQQPQANMNQYPKPGRKETNRDSPINENSQVMLSNTKSEVLAMALGVQVKTGEDPPTGDFCIAGYEQRKLKQHQQQVMLRQQYMDVAYGDGGGRQMSPGMEAALAVGNKVVMSSVSRRDESTDCVVELAAQNFKEREKLLHQRLMVMAGNIATAPSTETSDGQMQQQKAMQTSRGVRSRSRERHHQQRSCGDQRRDKYHRNDRRDKRELYYNKGRDRRRDGDRRERMESGGDRRAGHNRSGHYRSGDGRRRSRSKSRSKTPPAHRRRHSSGSPRATENRNGTAKSTEKTHTPSPYKERLARKAEQLLMLKHKMEAEIREQLIKKQQIEEAEQEQQRILKEKQRKAKEEAEMLDRAKRAQRDAAEKEKLLKTVKVLKELDVKKLPSASSKDLPVKRMPRSKRSPSSSSSSSSYSSSSSSSSSSDSSADDKKRGMKGDKGRDKKYVDKTRRH